MKHSANPDCLPGLDLLEQTPIIIEKILIAATPDELHWKPAPDRWSICEVLAHLVDIEQVYRKRARAMVEQDSPAIEPHDEKAAYAAGKYSSGAAGEVLRLFCHERDQSVTWLRYLPSAVRARKGRHLEIGDITLGHLLNGWCFHDLGHIRQISELYRTRAFYTNMGNFQRYYNPNP